MVRWRWVVGDSLNDAAVLRAESDLRWAEYDSSGRRIATGEGRLCAPTAEELAAWDRQAHEIIRNAAALGIDPAAPLYIRWGNLPPGGRSRNHATGELETGVSVYRARHVPDTGLIQYDDDGGLPSAALTYLLAGASCYLVTGREVGTGSDGEPVLRDVQIIAALQPTDGGFRLA